MLGEITTPQSIPKGTQRTDHTPTKIAYRVDLEISRGQRGQIWSAAIDHCRLVTRDLVQ